MYGANRTTIIRWLNYLLLSPMHGANGLLAYFDYQDLLSPMYGANRKLARKSPIAHLLSPMYGANNGDRVAFTTVILLSPMYGAIFAFHIVKEQKIIDIFVLKHLFLHFHN